MDYQDKDIVNGMLQSCNINFLKAFQAVHQLTDKQKMTILQEK